MENGVTVSDEAGRDFLLNADLFMEYSMGRVPRRARGVGAPEKNSNQPCRGGIRRRFSANRDFTRKTRNPRPETASDFRKRTGIFSVSTRPLPAKESSSFSISFPSINGAPKLFRH